MKIVTQTEIPELQLLSRGKVRDIYLVNDETLLLVTTDRMSAFDVVMNEPVPYKGVVLNQLTVFWLEKFARLVENHLLTSNVDDYPQALSKHKDMLEGRSMLVKRAQPLPIECIVRGYIAGSGWQDYQKTGTLSGHELPAGLKDCAQLPEPIFTPSTKADAGAHDENISTRQAERLLGPEVFNKVQELCISIYTKAASHALSKGIVIADTKFEFGMQDGRLVLIDEVLTPDSSRFWALEGYEAGHSQPSFDKQYLRDWLSAQNWDKTPPAPALPEAVIAETGKKYRQAYFMLTGRELEV